MARTREFDEDAVLAGAMHAFRRKGYEAVSVRDLEEATGLKAGSIYNAYGDKAGLFDAAFAHYNRVVLQGRIERFASAKRGLVGLRKLFLSLLQEPDRGRAGCLITNSAVELGGSGRSHPGVREGMQVLEKFFLERLTEARKDGTLRAEVEPAIEAAKLLALYQGVLVLVRAGHSSASLGRLIHLEFDQLEGKA